MALILMTFNDPIKNSCDGGGDVYTTPTTAQDAANALFLGSMGSLTLVGTVFAVVNGDGLDPTIPISLIIDHGVMPTPTIAPSAFMMFSKNKIANN